MVAGRSTGAGLDATVPHCRETNDFCAATGVPFPHVSSAARLVNPPPDRAGTLFHPGLVAHFGCAALLNFGLTPRHQPASDSLRQCPERRPCVGSLTHVHSMRSAHGNFFENDDA